MMINEEVKRQMQIILQGSAQVASEEELRTKIERSLRTGKPLTVKLGLDSPFRNLWERNRAVRPLVANGWVASGSELRRLVEQGGVQKNGEKVISMETVLYAGDVLRIGKKNFVKIKD